jgi:hypothetical protein
MIFILKQIIDCVILSTMSVTEVYLTVSFGVTISYMKEQTGTNIFDSFIE